MLRVLKTPYSDKNDKMNLVQRERKCSYGN